AECWFAHSYDPKRISPYPVCEAIRQAWAPVGLALETSKRRFYENETVETAVFITNDDDEFRDHHDLELQVSFEDSKSGSKAASVARITHLAYYETKKVPVRLLIPASGAARKAVLLNLRLLENNKELSQTTEPI